MTRLRRALSALPLPAWPDGRVRLAADVSNWLRPDAQASPQRLFGPEDDAAEVTAAQLREVITRITAAGHWKSGGPDVLVVLEHVGKTIKRGQPKTREPAGRQVR